MVLPGSHIDFLEGDGPRLALRHRAAQSPWRGAILFVHGATFASELYDMPLPGYSWMEVAAAAGREAFAVDLRGYALSERPASFERPAQEAEPYARAADVQADVERAVEAVREKTGAEQIDLLGGSWGTVICGLYATGPSAWKIRRLALYAPVFGTWNDLWLSICGAPGDPGRLNPDLGAYRWVQEDAIRQRWDGEIPLADKSLYREEAAFQALFKSALLADPLRRHAPRRLSACPMAPWSICTSSSAAIRFTIQPPFACRPCCSAAPRIPPAATRMPAYSSEPWGPKIAPIGSSHRPPTSPWPNGWHPKSSARPRPF